MISTAESFLKKNNMFPGNVDPDALSNVFAAAMQDGLEKTDGRLPMIPTYLKNSGSLPENKPVIVIDAGGTNFRAGLLTFSCGEYTVTGLIKKKMPGIDKPASWDEFISFIADNIQQYADKTDVIGFCFSYSADITPEIDGKVIRIDKEVVITDSEGKLVGKSLCDELSKRGYPGKRAFILNDTAAVLLGGCASLDKSLCSGCIGQVSGTGTNTCCEIALNRIPKLNTTSEEKIIVNLESGLFADFALGTFDKELDAHSNNSGLKYLEKVTAGVYLGELVTLMLRAAASEGLISGDITDKLDSIGKIDSAVIDGWAAGENLDGIRSAEDREFIRAVCLAMFERSARYMCSNLLGIIKFNYVPSENMKPVCVLAEGSLVQKGRFYRGVLENLLEEYAHKLNGYNVVLKIGNESTLPGAAAAALLNIE